MEAILKNREQFHPGMIKNIRALQEEFVPKEVVHRDNEIHVLAENLRPTIENGKGIDSLLHGPPGTGKTCVSRHLLEKLGQENPDVRFHYINCWKNYSRFKILYEALRGIGKTLNVHRQSTPTDKLYSVLEENVERPYVLILDEFDQIDEEEALYDLYSLPNVTMILIANHASALHSLEDRIRSRLMSCERIEFKKYSPDQLEDILKKRAEVGLEEEVDDSILRKIALSSEGDARIAISILRSSAIKARNKGKKITKEIVNDCIPEAKKEKKQKDVEKLNSHQKELYRIINDAGEIKPRDLYEKYGERVENPKSERSLRKYLKKMVHYNLIESEGEGRWRKYRSVES